MEKIFKDRIQMLESLPKKIKVAEIGVFKGDFAKLIYNILEPEELILIDIFEGRMGSGDKDGNNMEFINLNDYYLHLQDYFKNKNVKFIKGLSKQVFPTIDDDYLDMVYIDASHEYHDVKSDLEISFKKIKNGGYISGHDYDKTRFPGVYNAVNEFCTQHNQNIESITEDGLPSFIIKIKKKHYDTTM